MRKAIHLMIISLTCFSCVLTETESVGEFQFELLTADETGLNFENRIDQTIEFNVFAYMYIYNGGGVGVGDFNNDGLEDLFFSNNMGSNKLFLNKGQLKFEDVSATAGIEGIEGWSSGVSVVDINGDGLLDIYVNQLGDYKTISGHNQFFICKEIKDGVPYYVDESDQLGLDLIGFSTQSAFFDYDMDGDLDMYQLNHSVHGNGTFGQKKKFAGKMDEKSGDKLFRNDALKFVDVTQEAGIKSTVIGYGLGLAIGDINNDGWPDIYIGNDFHEDDYLYINNQDGSFSEVLNDQMMHTSRFSMGVDIADIDNDAQEDVISLDMLPEDPFILMSSLGEDDFDIFDFKLRYGYNHQYSRNNLQLNNGDGSFTEIGLYADMYATDWSWSPLFIDFDFDGYKDLFISNGIPRRMNDIDYVKFRKSDDDIRFRTNTNMLRDDKDLEIIHKMPQIKLRNKFFRNDTKLKFQDLQTQIKGDKISYSFGTAFADLDKDGDLDIITNNSFDKPFIYKNLQIEKRDTSNAYLSFHFKGSDKNSFAIGTRVIVWKAGQFLTEDNFPVRGYQSTVSTNLTIGLGEHQAIDSVLVIWPDQSYEKIQPRFNTTDTLSWSEGLPTFDFSLLKKEKSYPLAFEDITEKSNVNFCHKENQYVDFNREALIPFMVSREGPAVASGDINGDELEDFFIGNAKSRLPTFFVQKRDGIFQKFKTEVSTDNFYEDIDAELVDIDGDNDLDLIVASGGNEFWGTSEYLNPRLYLNDGKGNFEKTKAFQDIFLTASCVEVGDFNGDGLEDVFFGARSVTNNYGTLPESAIYINNGAGTFKNVSANYPKIAKAGFVKDAIWVDIDLDQDLDLVMALEWGPITAFLNDAGKFTPRNLVDYKSFWNFLQAEDFDGDGDIDILVGNTGENTKLKPTEAQPVNMYVNDFDDNGRLDQLLTYYVKGRELPFHTYRELVKQIPSLKKRFLYAKDFAAASLAEIFGKKLAESAVFSISDLSSVYLENQGDLNFKKHRLPTTLQLSSITTGLTVLRAHNRSRVLIGGNFYNNNIGMGRYDGNYGNLLTIQGDSLFVAPLGDLKIKGQVRKAVSIQIGSNQGIILGKNDNCMQLIRRLN